VRLGREISGRLAWEGRKIGEMVVYLFGGGLGYCEREEMMR
jgi:hypothetical protein